MIGKTCLIGYYKTRKYIDNDYKPTIFENTTVKIVIDKVKIELALWDTSGQDDYSRIRPLSYPGLYN
jgi:Ras-related C3 botulinum toxin substrate 1